MGEGWVKGGGGGGGGDCVLSVVSGKRGKRQKVWHVFLTFRFWSKCLIPPSIQLACLVC